MADNSFKIKLDKFYAGLSPTWWKNAKSSFGNSGHANAMRAVDVLDPTYITQGPGITALTGGTALTNAMTFIQSKYLVTGEIYAMGATKLYKLLPSSVTTDANWPHAITPATGTATFGSSVAVMGNYLYYFYNTNAVAGGDIGRHEIGTTTFDDDWGSTVPATGAARIAQVDSHPVAVKESTMLFGNGQYVGMYDAETDTLTPQKLDFGAYSEVKDIVFHNNYWYISVSRTNYRSVVGSQIYIYSAAAVSSLLSDEAATDLCDIGAMKSINGTLFVCYRNTKGNFVGYLSGKSVVEIGNIGDYLPTYNKVSERNGVMLLASGVDIYAVGAISSKLPFAVSKLSFGTGDTVDAIGGWSGGQIAQTNGAVFSVGRLTGFSDYGTWESLIFDMSNGNHLACIDKIIVMTKSLGTGATCALTVKTNQEKATSDAMTITTAAKTRHVFKNAINDTEDFKIALSWSGSSATNDCAIRSIEVIGHWKESI